MSKQIEEYAKEWKEFSEFREKKIALNVLSPEYKKACNDLREANHITFKYFIISLEIEREKGVYEATFEGMLSWIADGKPINK